MTALKKLFVLIAILEVILVGEVYASSAPDYIDSVAPLKLKVEMITEVEFPEKIANVTKSISSDFLQIETLENRMFLLPKGKFDSRIYAVTEDNVSYCLRLVSGETPAASRVKIRKAPQAFDNPQNKETISTIELMKALLNRKFPRGSIGARLDHQQIFNNRKLRITLDEVYVFPSHVRAFVLTFENLQHKPVVVPVEHIQIPGLLAVSVDRQILGARPRDITKKSSGAYFTKAYMIVQGLIQ